MSSNVRTRMDDLERLVIDKSHTIDKLSGVPFVVFTYDPNKELDVDGEIDGFVEKLEFNGIDVVDIDMRDLVFSLLDEEDLLDSVIEIEREDKEQLRSGLNSTFFEEVGDEQGSLIEAILERVDGRETAIIRRTGILYPFSSISVIFSQLENQMDIPLIVFYPAVREDKNLRFLDETDGAYYRAKVI